jgi:hypothetical protein
LTSLPLAFEPNVGQSASATKFIVHRPDVSAGFAGNSVTLLLPQKGKAPARLGIDFGRSTQIAGEQELPGKTNYFRGNNPAAWRTGIANFGRIRYRQLWPGTDVLFYGNGRQLEHDFIVAPGGDPRKISFGLDGAQSIETTQSGDLLVRLADVLITFKKPVAYQETTSGRRKVAAAFKLRGNRISFNLGRYDYRRPLTIDPVLFFSTFLVGSTFEGINGLAVDAQNNIYVTGFTSSTDFPTTPGSVQPVCAGCGATSNEAFITKLNPTGTALVYSTFLGGTADDSGQSIAVDSTGNAVIAGITQSSDFPAVNPIGTFSGGTGTFQLFISSLSATGAALNYSGIVGPLFTPVPFGTPFPATSLSTPLALDSFGNAYVTTETLHSSFPTTPSAIAPVPANSPSAVLVALKVSATGALVYSTAILGKAATGPSNPPPNTFFQNAIGVDSSGNAYIAGQGNDGLPTTPGVLGPAFATDSGPAITFPREGFLLKLNAAGSALTFATYIPATSNVKAMRLDASGNAYLGGETSSAALAVSANAFATSNGCAGCQSAYILKVNSQATATLGGTYVHGAPPLLVEAAEFAGLALDSTANIFATGIDSGVLPMVKPLIQTSTVGGFIVQLSSDFSTLLFSSGGPDALIQVAASGNVILAGNTTVFPPTPGAFQTTLPPGRTGFFAPFSIPTISAIDLATPGPTLCLNSSSLNFGIGVTAPGTTSAPQSDTVTNCGNADLHISSVTSDSPDYNVTTDCPLAPAGIAAGNSCKVTATYSPVDFNSGHAVIQDDAAASPHQVGLLGFPKAPVVSFVPGLSLTFPETPITTSDTLGMQIIGSTIIATVSSMTTTGDFTVSQNCLGALPPPHTIPFPPGLIGTPCNFTISFVPTNTGTRTGTLIVTDTALDSPQVIQLSGLGLSAWPTPAVSSGGSVNVKGTALGNVANSTGNPQTLALPGSGFSRLTTATLDGMIFDNNFRQISIVNPQEIDLHLADNDFGDSGEVPVKVITPTPGGGVSNNVVTITAPIRSYQLFPGTSPGPIGVVPTGNLVAGPQSGLIYNGLGLVVPGIPTPNGFDNVLVLDPVQERITTGMLPFPLSGKLEGKVLAVSDDEQFLYVGLSSTNAVAQVALPSGNINFMASLGADAALGNYFATAIRVMPGHPHTWVATLQPAGGTQPIALKVFDDAVPRANAVEHGNATGVFPGKLLFVGADTTDLFSIDSANLYRFTIDANGITFRDKTAGLGAEDFAADSTLLYLSTGAIIDPGTLANKGNFALAAGLPVHALVVDSTTSRAIFAGDATSAPGNGSLIQAFDTTTLAAKGTLTLPNLSGVNSIVRWGTNGLGFGFSSSPVTVTRSSLTGNSGLLAPFHIGANSGQAVGAVQVTSGSPAVFNLGILSVNGFTGPVTLSCSNLPLFASCSFSQNPVIPSTNLTPSTFTVTVNTHQAATASAAPPRFLMRSGSGFIVLTALLSLPFALVLARRHRGKWLGVCMLIAIIGCGGGGGGVGGPTPTPTPVITPTGGNTPMGTYDVTLIATSSAGTRRVTLQLIVL